MNRTFVLNLLVSLCPPPDVPPTPETSLSQLGILKCENPVVLAHSYFPTQMLCYLEIILDFDHPSGSYHTQSWPSLSEMRSSGSGALIPLDSVEIPHSHCL